MAIKGFANNVVIIKYNSKKKLYRKKKKKEVSRKLSLGFQNEKESQNLWGYFWLLMLSSPSLAILSVNYYML